VYRLIITTGSEDSPTRIECDASDPAIVDSLSQDDLLIRNPPDDYLTMGITSCQEISDWPHGHSQNPTETLQERASEKSGLLQGGPPQ